MKELSVEEKAKRYDEALEMAKKLIENEETNVPVFYVNNIKDIFPELKESEDERIKQELIEYHKTQAFLDGKPNNKHVKFVAWLEKQGEQPKKHDVCDNCDQQGGCVSPCPMKLVEKHGEQKPAEWSDEDETALGDALWCCKQAANIAKDENDMGNIWYAENWLKSLKYRVQPKQEWSEEDEKIIETMCKEGDLKPSEVQWLKSLRPQNRWKPSDELIKVLSDLIAYKEKWESSYSLNILRELLDDLKKLKD